MYSKDSPSYVVCEDVRLVNRPNTLPDHTHSIEVIESTVEKPSDPFAFEINSSQEASSPE